MLTTRRQEARALTVAVKPADYTSGFCLFPTLTGSFIHTDCSDLDSGQVDTGQTEGHPQQPALSVRADRRMSPAAGSLCPSPGKVGSSRAPLRSSSHSHAPAPAPSWGSSSPWRKGVPRLGRHSLLPGLLTGTFTCACATYAVPTTSTDARVHRKALGTTVTQLSCFLSLSRSLGLAAVALVWSPGWARL